MFSYYYAHLLDNAGHAVAQLVEALRVQFPMVSLDYFINIILPAALWPWSRISL